MKWKPAEEKVLKGLWEKDFTVAKIALVLGRGRNSVIGKAHRLNLSKRPNPVKRKSNGNEEHSGVHGAGRAIS